MISFCMLNIDRFDVMPKVLDSNISSSGVPIYELLFCDNGSTDKRSIDFLESKRPQYFRKNSRNEGVAHAFNQLLIRANGDYICLMGNDIRMPEVWAKTAIEYLEKVPYAGIAGFQCTAEMPPISTRGNITAHFLNQRIDKVFGTMVFKRKILEYVGGFCEKFEIYGCEDSDFNNRINKAGLQSFYIPGAQSHHLVNDVGTNGEYRKMKNEALTKNMTILGERMKWVDEGNFFEPLPEMRDPI